MQVHFGIDLLRAEWERAVVCIGTFDGVHLGHQTVIREAVAEGRAQGEPCVLVTFDRHPAAILAPEKCPLPIASLGDNLDAFRALGVSLALVLPFDASLSRMSAQGFLESILQSSLRADRVIVGHDFAMGHNRQGNSEWLAARIPTTVVPAFELDGERVSSSTIRRAILEGDVTRANRLLGRHVAIEGIVVKGQQLGRELGFPTANLARSFRQVLPGDGVYAGIITTRHGRYMAAVSIGMRPAVNGTSRTIEAHLLDYPGASLYGDSVRLELVRFLRPETDFASLEALIAQIGADVETTRECLGSVQFAAPLTSVEA